jgi:exopolysaccharide production protein ExoQ
VARDKYSRLITLLDSKAFQLSALLIVALLFGGGGSGAGLANLVVQLTALLIIAINPQAVFDFFRQAPRLPTILVGGVLVLPLVQSIPLPTSVWQSLPGRSLVSESLALVGGEGRWFPMSLNVWRTLIAFLSLVPPVTIVVLAWRLSEAQKNRLLLLVAAMGIFTVLIGTLQLTTGNRIFVFFSEAFGSGDLQGSFANRNCAGLFLDVALCALIGGFPDGQPRLKEHLAGAAMLILLVVGVILTRSRTSMVLMLVPLAFLAFRVSQARTRDPIPGRKRTSWRTTAAVAIGIALFVGGAVTVVLSNERIQHSLSRFDGVSVGVDNLQDRRALIWADTTGSIKRFWPIGSGIGTFDEVFQTDETLENLRTDRAARAHNDYLELTLESGLIGIALMAGWLYFLITRGLRVTRESRAGRSGGWLIAPVAVLALFAFQSVLDYPLRSQILLCIAGLMVALLIDEQPQARAVRRQDKRQAMFG